MVFPPDERTRITPTTTFPARSIAYIISDGQWECSGTFISSNLVLTAAHCLYDEDIGGWATITRVIPGKDGAREPYGSQFASGLWVPDSWYNSVNNGSGNLQWDWGLIFLPNDELGKKVNWLKIGVLNSTTLASASLRPVTNGYPGDKAPGTQWTTGKDKLLAVTDFFLVHDLDVYQGQSGSALRRNSDNLVVGVVSFERSIGGVAIGNYATRIDREFLQDLLVGCQQLGCSFEYFIEQPTPTPTPSPIPVLPTATPVPVLPTATATPRPATLLPTVTPVPATSSNYSPVDGANLPNLAATLSWQNPPGTTQVHVQVFPANNDGPGVNIIMNTATQLVIPPPPEWYVLLPGMTYTWRVRTTTKPTFAPENDSAWGQWSSMRRFRTPNTDSSQISPVFPPQLSTQPTGQRFSLIWSHPSPSLFYWEVQVSGDARFDTNPATATSFVYWNLVHGGITTPKHSWTPPSNLPPGNYFWRVRPRIQGDGTPAAWGPVWTFTVR